MILQGFNKEEDGTSLVYNFAWRMDLEHCLFFMDSLLSCIQKAKGKIGDLIVYYKDCDEMESLRDKYIEYNGDIFTLFSSLNKQVASIGVSFAQSEQDTPLYLVVEVGTEYCIVRAATDSSDIETPDLLLSRAEILAHVAYTCQHCEKGDSNE